MNALLMRLAEKEQEEELDPQTKEWRRQVREMAYDIEDFIDLYMHRIQHESEEPAGVKAFFRKKFHKVKKLVARHGLAEQIQELKAQIISAKERQKRYKIDASAISGDAGVVAVDPRLPALYEEAANLVGVDGPREDVVNLLHDGEKPLKVVSIVGFGGLGKTTLANQVYQQIGKHYDCQAFVSVSQKPSMQKNFMDMLSELKNEKYQITGFEDEKGLISELRDFLKDKRYLIVIDDTWSTKDWEIIRCGLPNHDCGSRIILTTRIATVAKLCCSSCPGSVYELQKLSEANSKTLFFRRIFGSEDKCPPHLEGVASDIIGKCGGLPLAIITMASLLTTKSEAREEWITVQKSIGLGLEKHADVKKMRTILSLSYNDLPFHLKTCLLYLSIFPEDYIINMNDLVRRWIAEGFIHVDGDRGLMEVGVSFFNELINRSMIQLVEIRYDGQEMECRVHDMILDLIISKAVEENFVKCIGDYKHKSGSLGKVRRLSLHGVRKENITLQSIDTAHVRSLSIFDGCEMLSILDFPSMRMLSIEISSDMENIYMVNIGMLFQLRYLRICSRKGFTRLPKEIRKLQLLGTLDLACTDIRKLPESIVELQQLKHLFVDRAQLPDDGISKMQALEELSFLLVDKRTAVKSLHELGNLTKLRALGFDCEIDVSDDNDKTTYEEIFVVFISKLGMSSLRSLSINNSSRGYLGFLYGSWSEPPHLLQRLQLRVLSEIPAWMASLANLTYLKIDIYMIIQQTLNILGALPALAHLGLWNHSPGPTERLIFGSNSFRCLKDFRFGCFLSIVNVMFEAGAMPKLETLRLDMVESVADLGIRHLLALKSLTVWINCDMARVEQVEALEEALRNEAGQLPKRPTPDFQRAQFVAPHTTVV